MTTMTLTIIGAAIGWQFDTMAAILGAYLGLVLATQHEQARKPINTDCSSDDHKGLSSLPDFLSDSPHLSLLNPELPTFLHEDISDSSTLFDDQMGFSGSSYINPASGLPMIDDGFTGFDVGGNIFGASSDDFL